MINSNSDSNQFNPTSATNDGVGPAPPTRKHLNFSQAFTGKTATTTASKQPNSDADITSPVGSDRWTPSDQATTDSANDWESPYSQPTEPDVVPKAQPSDVITATSGPKPKRSKKPILGALMALLLVIGGAAGFYLVNQNQDLRQQASSVNTVIATVGQEKIYQKDLDIELQYFPPVAEVNGQPTSDYLLDKIIQDSQVLQALGKTSDASIYNNTEKDYLKRTDLVQDLLLEQQAKLENENAFVQGKALTIWYNNQDYGDIPLAERKTTIQNKINALREQVSNGSLSIDQAIQQVQADSSLESIDPSYRPNANYPFGLIQDSDLINQSQPLTDEVKTLDIGGVSQVYDHSLSDNEQMFIFAVVTEKKGQRGNVKTLDMWLEEISNQYNVQKQ